jgi:putative FmdB family regulatory protein
MPIYEYVCRDCSKDFEAIVASGKRDEGTACPECGGQKVARKISLMANPVVKSGKSGGSSEPFSCGAPSCCGGMCGIE